MILSRNFTLQGMIKSATAERYGISNIPTREEIDNMKKLCMFVLQPVRDHFGKPMIINSGFRCPELNRILKGKSNSFHKKGLAADVEIYGVDNMELAVAFTKYSNYDKVILEFYNGTPNSGWVHVQYLSHESNRKGTYSIGRVENKIVTINGFHIV